MSVDLAGAFVLPKAGGGSPAGGSKWHVTLMTNGAASETSPTAGPAEGNRGDFAGWELDNGFDDEVIWTLHVPAEYGGGDLSVSLLFDMQDSDGDDVNLFASFGRVQAGDSTSTTFAAARGGATPTNAGSDEIYIKSISFTNAQADALQPGDWIQLKVERPDSSDPDANSGSVFLLGVAIQES